MIFLEILGWLCLSLVLMSLLEYVAHRWPMHSRRLSWLFPIAFESHTLLHHGRFYRTFEGDDDPAAKHVSVDLGPGLMLLGLLPLWGGLCLVSLAGGLTLAVVIASHGFIWTRVHREMHEPRGRWFSSWWLYRYWLSYHRTHHEHPGRNFNVLLPFMDPLFGTYGGEDEA